LDWVIHQIMLLSLWPFVLKLEFFFQFCLLHEMLHNLRVQLLYFTSFFLNYHQLWISTFLKRWMLTFLSVYIYFTLIMYSWLKFTLITKLFLFLFPYFSHEYMNFYIFFKDIIIATHEQNTSIYIACIFIKRRERFV
jgi:hypothetical protein